MLKEKERFVGNLLGFIDIAITLSAFVFAYFGHVFVVGKFLNYSNEYITLILLILPTWFFLLKLMDMTQLPRIKSYAVIVFEYTIIVGAGIGILVLFIFVFKLNNISRIFLTVFTILDFFLLSFVRISFYIYLKKCYILCELDI